MGAMLDNVALLTAFIFLLAGFVKGVMGLGLPTVSMGLLALIVAPAEAAALLVVPSIATNVWQAVAGPGLGRLLRRLWPMMVCVCLGTWAGAGLLTGTNAHLVSAALGTCLVLYALLGLSARRWSVRASSQPWLSPPVGLAAGLVTAATGTFVIPGLLYLQALGLEKEDFVQALGIYFLVSTFALAGNLLHAGVLSPSVAATSLVALLPAVAGMGLGQLARLRLSEDLFRLVFFVGMLMLGAYLAGRALV